LSVLPICLPFAGHFVIEILSFREADITGQTAWLLRRLLAFKVQADLDRLFLYYTSGMDSVPPSLCGRDD